MNKIYAPNGPGVDAKWTSAAKSGIGKSLSPSSEVTFTITNGILTEVYYPEEDIACIREMAFVVTDGKNFYSNESTDTHNEIKIAHDGLPAYEIINTDKEKNYRLHKEVISDPFRDTVLQKVTFEPFNDTKYHVYVLLSPHLNNQGSGNTGWIGDYKGINMLFAENAGLTLALACSFKFAKCSVGYAGTSDGWTDLEKNKKLTSLYTNVNNGNIVLTGEINISKKKEFVLALGFGRNAFEAANHAWGSILDGFDSAKKWYIDEWESWLKNLHDVNGKNFRISASVLRMHESKSFPGAIVASLSIPWGNVRGDMIRAGYHVTWPRDLIETAGGFIALKTGYDALRILNYVMSTQQEDGSWPQNMWLSGDPFWKAVQIDQTALPLLLFDKCIKNNLIDKERMQRYWPRVKKAISFLIKNAPFSQQDRWEEESGYTPFTVAASIAGLLVAADIAELNCDLALANYCRETADYWNDNIEHWLYVTGTNMAKESGVNGYYIRVNPFIDVPASDLHGKTIRLKNQKTLKDIAINEYISIDALALVRFGLRAANDSRIISTLTVIDKYLKVDTPHGTSWHRYNNDGYGEDENGNGFIYGGIGRAWPLLTGERGHYEIAAGNIDKARELLKAMDEFANHGLISEQIWDSNDIPEKGLFCGKHTGSAMPLAWAHAEYIKLCTSIQDQRVFDMPQQTVERYINTKHPSQFKIWRFNNQINVISSNMVLRIEVLADAIIHWTDDNWNTIKETETKDTCTGIFLADIPVSQAYGNQIIFTFYWKEPKSWEKRNFEVNIQKVEAVILEDKMSIA